MAQLLDHIDYLAREIGPRPAGTEEEQQAALYIADQMQRESGFHAEIEEFTSSSNLEGARAIPSVVIVLAVVLAIIFNAFTIPAFVLTLLAAAVYVLEAFDRPFVSRFLARGASQNVVAKYQPEASENDGKRGARRKIVLVAHYDTGKVKPALVKTLEDTGLPLGLIVIGAMALSALLLIVRIPVGGMGGPATIVLNALSIIALVVLAAPIVKAVLYRIAPYNEGANNNASGTAALIEVARRISSGSISEAELINMGHPSNVVVHGEQAARESGLVPEGADLVYEEGVESALGDPTLSEHAESDVAGEFAEESGKAEGEAGEQVAAASARLVSDEPADDTRSEEERLLAAKAAIAALTGRPVENRVYASPASREQLDSEQVGLQEALLPSSAGSTPAPNGIDAAGSLSNVSADPAETESATSLAGAPADDAHPAKPVATTSSVAVAASPGETGGFQNAPDWFLAAQRNAKKPAGEISQAQRSRYTQAIENAEREALAREAQRAAEDQARRAAEQRARNEAARSAMAAQAAQDEAQPEPVSVSPRNVDAEVMPSAPSQSAAGNGTAFPALSEGTDSGENTGIAQPLPLAADGQVEEESLSASPVADPGQTVAHLPIHLQDLQADQPRDQSALPPDASDAAMAGERDEAAPALQGRDEQAQAPAASAGEKPDPASGQDSEARAASTRGALAGLPQVEPQADSKATVPENDNPSRSGIFRKLRANVPSLSGAIRMPENDEEPLPGVSPQRSRSPLASSQIPAVKVKAATSDAQAASSADAVDYDMEVPVFDEDPADMPAAEGSPQTSESAQDVAASVDAGSSSDDGKPPAAQVEMPTSRTKGLRGRRRRKNAQAEESLQEWLDVDENFDARTVGRDRGSWESFRDDSTSTGGERSWQGGGFSRVHLDYVDTRSGEGAESDMPSDLVQSEEDIMLNEEIGQIIHFRNPQFNTEVWFVAIGSDTELHDGAKAFVAEHERDLRGAMVIEVESLGAGALAYASSEGQFRRVNASSRIKRYTRDAIEATGIALDAVQLAGTDSVASTIQKAGYQTMHLLGVEDGRPALKGSADDVVENIDELTLEDNVNFLMELLRHN